METGEYTYYNPQTRGLDFDGMLTSLTAAAPGDVVLLHGCCHNPTGIDPAIEQWETLAKFCAERQLLPFFDFAYQEALPSGVEEDAAGLRCTRYHINLVASSFSKNFGLYSEQRWR